jgi:hypothetical protein
MGQEFDLRLLLDQLEYVSWAIHCTHSLVFELYCSLNDQARDLSG